MPSSVFLISIFWSVFSRYTTHSRHMQVYNKDVVRVQKCSVVTAKSYLEKSTVFVIYSDVLIIFLRGEY